MHSFISGKGWRIGYTYTAWKDHETMYQFRNSGSHKIAMKQIRNVSSKYRTAVWESDKIPEWNEALKKLGEIQFKNI